MLKKRNLLYSKWFYYGLIAIVLFIVSFFVLYESVFFANDFAMRFLPTLIGLLFNFVMKMGRLTKLYLEKKVNIFILVKFLNKSNRNAEESLQYFQPLFVVDVSYKYIERLYSDPEVKLALHNLFVLLLKEEGKSGD